MLSLAASQKPPEIWTPWQTAKFLGITRGTLDRWRYHGKGPVAHRVGSQIRYFPQDVMDWVKSCPIAGKPVAPISTERE